MDKNKKIATFARLYISAVENMESKDVFPESLTLVNPELSSFLGSRNTSSEHDLTDEEVTAVFKKTLNKKRL